MKAKAQVSLELILLMSVFFSILLLFTPLIQKTFFLGIYVLDVSRAKNFSDSFSVAVQELNAMSNGSKISVTAEPLTEWKIKTEKEKLTVKVFLEKYSKEKTFSSEQFNIIPFEEFSLKEKTLFVLTKTEKGVKIEIQKV